MTKQTPAAENKKQGMGDRPPSVSSWSSKHGIARKFALGLAMAACISGIATVLVMTGSGTETVANDTRLVVFLLALDAILAASLSVVVGHRLVKIWLERRLGRAGSGLHVRMAGLFSLVAAVPAMLMAVVALIFLDQGLQAWFSKKVSTALGRSEIVATAYLQEHRKNFRGDVLEMANRIDENARVLSANPKNFARVLTALVNRYDMEEAYVIDGEQRVLAQSEFSFSLALDREAMSASLEKAREGGIVVLSAGQNDKVRILVRLTRFQDAFLIAGRYLDSRVLDYLAEIKRAVGSYKEIESKRQGIEVTFGLIFVVTAVLLVLAAIWLGLTFANQIAHPISSLIAASERVRGGDLTAQVAPSGAKDEIGDLGRAFNRMTSKLDTQNKGLITANRELDERRRFTETVLEGVSAGVVGLDGAMRITLPNRSASILVGVALEESVNLPLSDVIPEMRDIIDKARSNSERRQRTEVRILRDELVRTLDVRVVSERIGDSVVGYVVTFDDVTELMSAQRKAAWSDVARRIAHEIKNPLTPIQLAAERLRRKYENEITTDPETFETCIDTIVRQVADIGRLVDEFSTFARMPDPEMSPENLSELCRQAVFLEKNRHRGLNVEINLPEGDDIWISCDQRQISRAIGNLLKNASEAVTERAKTESRSPGKAWVRLTLDARDAEATIQVEDNGPGLPKADRETLTEPYVTSRVKGTGLGLAIVKKIMEDHDGRLELGDSPGGGALIGLVFNTDVSTGPRHRKTDETTNAEVGATPLATEIR